LALPRGIMWTAPAATHKKLLCIRCLFYRLRFVYN
jgi:hypothetical protein